MNQPASPNEAPNGSPVSPGWTEGESTDAQASRIGLMHMGYDMGSQVVDSGMTDGHAVDSRVREDQTDTMGVEKDMNPSPESFKRTTIFQEKMSGGYTPNTAPVGQGTPAGTPTPGGRNLDDTEALARLKAAADYAAVIDSLRARQ